MQMLAPLFKHFFPAWAVDNADKQTWSLLLCNQTNVLIKSTVGLVCIFISVD